MPPVRRGAVGSDKIARVAADDVLIEGRDYELLPDGRLVFTAAYLLRRGTCCESGCRNCPYGFGREAARRAPSPSNDGERSS